MDIEEVMRRGREERRQVVLNRTWRNPRYYVMLTVFPFVLVPTLAIWATLWVAEKGGEALASAARAADRVLGDLIRPFSIWVNNGARKEKAVP